MRSEKKGLSHKITLWVGLSGTLPENRCKKSPPPSGSGTASTNLTINGVKASDNSAGLSQGHNNSTLKYGHSCPWALSCVLGVSSWVKSQSGEVSVLIFGFGHRLGPGRCSWSMSRSSEVTVLGDGGCSDLWNLALGFLTCTELTSWTANPAASEPSGWADLLGSQPPGRANLLECEPCGERTFCWANLLGSEPPDERTSCVSGPPGRVNFLVGEPLVYGAYLFPGGLDQYLLGYSLMSLPGGGLASFFCRVGDASPGLGVLIIGLLSSTSFCHEEGYEVVSGWGPGFGLFEDKSPSTFLKMTYHNILVAKFSWHIQLFIYVWHL